MKISNQFSKALLHTGGDENFFTSPVFAQIEPKVVNTVIPDNGYTIRLKTTSGTIIALLRYYSAPITKVKKLTISHPFTVPTNMNKTTSETSSFNMSSYWMSV